MTNSHDFSGIIRRRGGRHVPIMILVLLLFDANLSVKNRLMILSVLAYLLDPHDLVKYARKAGLDGHLA